MSGFVKAQPRRVSSKLRSPDKFYVYNDDNPDASSDEFVATKCNTNSTQTNDEQKLCSTHKIEKSNVIITPRKKLKRRKGKLMDWKKYHRLNVIYSFIDDLERDYPAICTVTVIGKSVEGRDIKMLKISNSKAGNPGVWLDACIHSREWITTAVVTYMANLIVRNFHKLSTEVTNKDCRESTAVHATFSPEVHATRSRLRTTVAWPTAAHGEATHIFWHIVPVLNPDGYEYTHTHERMWRKNRAKYGGECVGVDLNRNFSYAWGQGDEGSSNEPKHVFYRGPAPFSEPETAAVRDAVLGSESTFKVFLSFHSYYELIIFPWGNRTEPCPDYVRLLEAGSIMARAIFETTGKTYKVGSTKDLTYFACGTSIDWSYSIAKIPYSFMVELRSRKSKFRLPKDQILETCSEAWNAVQKLMDYVDSH